MEEKKRRGRPPKSAAPAIVPNRTEQEEKAAKKYPMNPDPDIQRIRKIALFALEEDAKPFVDLEPIGAQYAYRYGTFRHALKTIADELGVLQ